MFAIFRDFKFIRKMDWSVLIEPSEYLRYLHSRNQIEVKAMHL